MVEGARAPVRNTVMMQAGMVRDNPKEEVEWQDRQYWK